jgi:predicted transport protein
VTKHSASKNTKSRAPASRWKCPKCGRSFTQVNQRHACGTSDGSDVLRDRPESVVRTYAAVEAFVKSLGEIEIVARDRYVLFRSVRIFADLNIMADAVRAAIHLERKVEDPRFIKVVEDRKRVTHVVKLQSESDVDAIKAYIREAYEVSQK